MKQSLLHVNWESGVEPTHPLIQTVYMSFFFLLPAAVEETNISTAPVNVSMPNDGSSLFRQVTGFVGSVLRSTFIGQGRRLGGGKDQPILSPQDTEHTPPMTQPPIYPSLTSFIQENRSVIDGVVPPQRAFECQQMQAVPTSWDDVPCKRFFILTCCTIT